MEFTLYTKIYLQIITTNENLFDPQNDFGSLTKIFCRNLATHDFSYQTFGKIELFKFKFFSFFIFTGTYFGHFAVKQPSGNEPKRRKPERRAPGAEQN
jgi:hypothetical protein